MQKKIQSSMFQMPDYKVRYLAYRMYRNEKDPVGMLVENIKQAFDENGEPKQSIKHNFA